MLLIISLLVFVINTSNFIFYISELGHIQTQFLIYSSIELISWLFILYRFVYREINIKNTLLLVFTVLIFFLEFKFSNYNLIKFESKCLQFYLGMILLFKCSEFGNKSNDIKINIYLPVGLILYSLTAINISFFRDFLNVMKDSNFYTVWAIHQFAAIIYFSLLSISIWKSQKI